jgi:7,8-dihydropterin-6-yl-methyl-4-(beta-D-ribofuranosyl)aminobenzene 5'-phosphate synthase
MAISFSILIDNEAHKPGLMTEHGLSVWIDTGATRILFDAGQSGKFLRNAQMIGIDPSTADHLVISHGHYDHTGGLASLDGSLPPDVPIHAHPEIFRQRYSRHADGNVIAIGLPELAEKFLSHREKYFKPVTESTEIAPRVWLTGEVPRETEFEDTGGDFWRDANCSRPDLIEDDLSLWVERDEGLWIFLGCAHAGVINIVRHIQAVSGIKKVHALSGGTHLRNASAERLEKTAAFLRELSPNILLPCHCSGDRINDLLRNTPSGRGQT